MMLHVMKNFSLCFLHNYPLLRHFNGYNIQGFLVNVQGLLLLALINVSIPVFPHLLVGYLCCSQDFYYQLSRHTLFLPYISLYLFIDLKSVNLLTFCVSLIARKSWQNQSCVVYFWNFPLTWDWVSLRLVLIRLVIEVCIVNLNNYASCLFK